MRFTSLLTLCLVTAIGISAHPTGGKPETPACLLSGNDFNGANKECQCPRGQIKKYDQGKCGYAEKDDGKDDDYQDDDYQDDGKNNKGKNNNPKTPACLLSGNDFYGANKKCRCPRGQIKKYDQGKCGYPGEDY